MTLMSVLIVTRLERRVSKNKKIKNHIFQLMLKNFEHQMLQLKLSDILKIRQDSLRIDDDNTI